MPVGSVVSITPDSLTVDVSGVTSSYALSSRTTVVGEQTISRGEIALGDRVLVIGERGANDTVHAVVVRVVAAMRQGGQRGDRGGGGPVMGEIVDLSPLRVRDDAGRETTVNAAGMTRFFREISIASSDILPGETVRVIAPPSGRGGSPEALKVIRVAEGADSRPGIVRGSRQEVSAASRTEESEQALATLPLPDLPRQPLDSDFFYGIWIGRGKFDHDELDRAFAAVNNLGISTVKVEFKWDYVESSKDAFVWDGRSGIDVDYVIELARRHDIAVIPYFDMFMPWGETRHLDPARGECEGPPNMRGQKQPPIAGEYAEYVFSVVERLRKGGVRVDYIELDNEVSNLNDGLRSWNCFINVTAREVKAAQNAAYDRVKSAYPDIRVSTTTFSFPGIMRATDAADMKRKDAFIKEYFGAPPRPKFDFLGLHETLSGSGNPFTTIATPAGAGYRNFTSYNEAYGLWRDVLDTYGYRTTPILNLESAAVLAGKQDAELIQRAVFARTSAERLNVRGFVVSQLTGSRRFTEGGGGGAVTVGITKLGSGFVLREGYHGYYALLKTLPRYPKYVGRVTGSLNKGEPWVEEFRNERGDSLFVCFIPYGRGGEVRRSYDLTVGAAKRIVFTKSDATSMEGRVRLDGTVAVEVSEHPVFVEAIR
jgi:hypothetical protein